MDAGSDSEERLSTRALQQQATRLALATRAAGLGVWEWDIAAEQVIWDAQMYALYQVDPETFEPSLGAWTNRVLPNDLPALLKTLDALISVGRSEATEFHVLAADGTVATHSLHAVVERDAEGVTQRVIGAVRDISQQKITEAQLRWQGDRLALATVAAGIGIWYWNLAKNNIEWDERVGELLDASEGENPHSFQRFVDCIDPDDRAQVLEQIRHSMEISRTYSMEFRVRHRSGQLLYVQTFGAPVMNQDGQTEGMLGVAYDVSERKALVDKLRERVAFETLIADLSRRFVNVQAEDLDRAIMGALRRIGEFGLADRCYVGLFDAQHTELRMSGVWRKQGVGEEVFPGLVWHQERLPWLLHSLHGRDAIYFPSLADVPQPAVREQKLLRELGVLSWLALPLWSGEVSLGILVFEGVVEPHRWSDEVRQRLRVIADIFANALERQRKVLQLSISAARQRALIEAIPDLMYRVDRNGWIKDYSRGASSSTAWEPVLDRVDWDGSSERITQFLEAPMQPVLLSRIEEALQTAKTQILECNWREQDRDLVCELRLSPCGGDEVIAIVRDISERARLDRMRSDFINDASHELRTPITTIIMMVELLSGGGEPEEVAEYWRVLRAELDRAHLLIEDLLAWGRLESGRAALAVEPQDVAVILSKATESVRPLADSRQIRLHLDIPSDLPLVLGNNYALLQVFVNLLNNAVKFTPDGGQVIVVAGRSADDDGYLEISVSDTGIGIPAYELPNLFGRFFRASNALEAEIPGSGMGLYLIKGILDETGGGIRVRSTEGVGTVFTATLPVTRSPGKNGTPRAT